MFRNQIHHYIKGMMFLHYILHQNATNAVICIFHVQSENSCKEDWGEQVYEDIRKINMNVTFDDKMKLSKHSFRTLVTNAT